MKRQPASSFPEEEKKPITLIWKREDATDVNNAKERFLKHLKAGWLAFAVSSDGRRAQVFEFDPKIEKIILIPIAEGG